MFQLSKRCVGSDTYQKDRVIPNSDVLDNFYAARGGHAHGNIANPWFGVDRRNETISFEVKLFGRARYSGASRKAKPAPIQNNW
jgi:hypothetical protein